MWWRGLLLLAATSCTSPPGTEEVTLSRRSRDAGPAVIIVDRAAERSLTHTAEEKEPNDAKSGGQAVALPFALRGRIDAAEDVDVYTLTIPTAGTLRVLLSGIEDADLVLELQAPGGQLLASSDNGPAKIGEAIPNLAVVPGTVQLVVREYVKPWKPKKKKEPKPPGRQSPSGFYVLEATLNPPPALGEEHEPNNETAFAEEIALGQAARGYIGWKKDVDYWKVSLEGVREDEALTVDVDGIGQVALKVAVLDAAGAPILERRGQAGATLALRSVQIREKTSYYFIAVSGDRWNVDEPYTLRVATAQLVLDEETEPNDSAATASPLTDVPGTESGTRVGTLPVADVDFYQLEPSTEGRLLSLTLTPPPAVDVELAVVGADGKPIGTVADAGKKGAVEKLAEVALPSQSPAYVRVTAKAGAGETERYKLKWSLSTVPAAVPSVDE